MAAADEDDEKEAPPKFDNMKDMFGAQNCPNFRCSAGHTPVPKSRLKFDSAGCSAMGSGMVAMTGGEADGEKPYASCCDQWHACYQVCGASKKKCDADFETCSEGMCKVSPDAEACKKDVQLSTMLMKLGGCTKFDQEQYKACECTAKDKVASAREAAIRYFYKKQAPENVEKAPQLAARAETPSQMAGLLLKLLKKYPDIIQHIEVDDPMAEMMKKMKDSEASAQGRSETEQERVDDDLEEEEKVEL